MEMLTRILGKMLNSEVQDYLDRNDIILIPVGTTEMHGGFPLDCETVISEASGPQRHHPHSRGHHGDARRLPPGLRDGDQRGFLPGNGQAL